MIGVRILLFAFALLLVIPFSVRGDVLPQSIASMTIEELQSGEEARQEIDRLHGKHITFRRGYIGTYQGGNERAKLWVSEYGSDGEATEAIGKMAQGVGGSKQGGFWHFREISVEGVPVYLAVGMGQVHYFFQKGIRVIWLAVDPPIAKQAIRDVIGKIP